MENWRIILYLPLGLLPAFFFGSRMLLQWWQSEKQKKSLVTPLFWKLSIIGNLILYLHHVVQVQVQFALLQAINALIAWRNLDFLRQDKEPYERKWVFALIGGAILGTLALFAFQGQFFAQGMEWVRSPRVLLSDVQQHPAPIWYVVGGIGAALFASRIWVQWWIAEFHQKSALGRSYWILSILGSTILLLYSWYTRDVVIAFYNLFSLIPYLRNLMLIRRQKRFSFKEM